MASKKKHVRDARFRDRASSPPKDAQPSPSKPAPPRAAADTRNPEPRRQGQPPRRGPLPPPPSAPPPPPWWRSGNVLVPAVLALGLGAAVYSMVRERQSDVVIDAGVYAPEVRTEDAAVDGSAAPSRPTPAAPAPVDAAAAVDAAVDVPALGDAGPMVALNGNPLTAEVPEPTSPDPRGGRFTLAQATEGLAGRGDLVAEIDTSMGVFTCTLLAGEAPLAVANFVGLARGRREFWDPVAARWVRRPFYDGSIFHRVIPEFMIQGGDQLRSGVGGTGYTFADENVRGHNAAGQLCMANRGPNTNGAQFFITEGPTAQLDGSYSIFGRCTPADLVGRIARVPVSGTRPIDPVFIRQVRVRRG